MHHIVTQHWEVMYPDPIELEVGQIVQTGKEEEEAKWKGWIWAETDTHKGWVPIQILERKADGTTAVVKSAYSARELAAMPGDRVRKVQSLNGWSWCERLDNGLSGWLPDEILAPEL